MIQSIKRAQETASFLSRPDIYNELEILKNRVETSELNIRNFKHYLKPERVIYIALYQKLETLLKRKERKYALISFASTLPTAAIYTGMYFSLIPKHYLETNTLLYLTAFTIIFSMWILWFIFIRKIYKSVLEKQIFPYIRKNPTTSKNTEKAAISILILVTNNPLFQAAFIAGKIITPSWGMLAKNLWTITIGVGSGNFVTAIANSIGVLSFLFILFTTLKRKINTRREKNAFSSY